MLGGFVQRLWQQHIALGQGRHLESRRQHSHHQDRRTVDWDGPAHHFGVAGEMALPQAIGNHRHARPVRAVLVVAEHAADRRLNPQHVEKIRFHLRAMEA